ncbi:NAD-dependent epimerase/dehydratase family protein [Kribbella capetownensis]|uniref:NAD-dependent epimerase/dehydratase family protein n=1 Tax=Kribbella capetownensis TaxID=1572659 RepID=A0A4R0K7V6_9ACTN|nr:NAD-dependent epimerase/dehydratase family protein [Kribbella capetownensis]
MVTGVSRDAGARCARRLADDPSIGTVLGVDVVPPRAELGRVRFVRADIRNPVIAKVIAAEGVDTVVHTGVVATPGSAGGRSSMKEINVIGTMQLLAACQKAPGVAKLVVKSSTTVYGAGPRDPAMFTEEMAPRAIHQTGLSKDAVEVEGYVRGFARRRPDVRVSTLRMANWIGPKTDSPITRYFAMPVVPTVFGYDARLQFLHEDDGVEAIHHATVNDLPGTFNLAGDGVLSLSQAIRKLGRPALRLPSFTASSTAAAVRRARLADFSPDQITFLTYGRAVDTTRMRAEFGFEPKYTTAAAFDDFRDSLRPGAVARAASLLTAGLGALRG